MKLAELWRTKGGPTLSFELFPARDAKAAASLQKVIDQLTALRPDFVSVTFGAGGSTRDDSRELAAELRRRGLEVLAYFAGYGMAPEQITTVLDGYRALGVENVLVVRGDVPKDDPDFKPHPQGLAHASDLLELIRSRYDLCLGAAGYPEGHVEAESRERDWDFLKLKVDHGAQFIIAQYFYDNRFFFELLEGCRARGVTVPIVPGVMPIFNVKMMENLARLCGATITDELRAALAALPEGDKEALSELGIALAVRQCSELLRAGVPGIHIYTMDRAKSAVEIVRRLRADGLIPAGQ
jgi:methylenetetrahydrofolate reductase (NADPH)